MYKRVENLVEETGIKNIDSIAMEYSLLMVAQAKKPDEIMLLDSGKANTANNRIIIHHARTSHAADRADTTTYRLHAGTADNACTPAPQTPFA
jgi:hypothetical protein